MNRERIEELRARVSCALVLSQAGFALDIRESSRGAQKFRRGSEILIVTHQGAGWFDPLSEMKGDVFSLVRLIERVSFPAALKHLGALAGVRDFQVVARLPARRTDPMPVAARWARRPALGPGSPATIYLEETRALPRAVLLHAAGAGLIRQGPCGSAWFRHDDETATLSGWEERGPDWRGFAKGGFKSLFRFGDRSAPRVCITEAAVDALSLAALEAVRSDTLYTSTGGGWSPTTAHAIAIVAANRLLVAATDADPQGDVYADRLRHLADQAGADFRRLRPKAVDWNEEWKERREGDGLPHAVRPRQG
ncbi:DUF3991 and toprim domain-containing protein [Rhizobium sp. XQZ8]|uniref:DUF3991 and toprim domain-containing protein n=1 Tax=Rhizobium populisoli TaxID=2859785 RepID=UPI001C670847|nr:DUF3991 and toprim domain-containing protein [Rhizobium populisoli]MBW6425441.1 DUF3991 and toprim domain-containing protein [Rhizobium populisoli]